MKPSPMRRLLTVLLVCITSVAAASELRIAKVTLPLYLHGSETDVEISFETVPIATTYPTPEWRYSAISTAYVPPSGGYWKPTDINLTSVYGISVEGTEANEGKTIVVTIDASKAVKPEGYPFTIEQVIDAVTTCVKLMTPPRPVEDEELKINVKRPNAKKAEKTK